MKPVEDSRIVDLYWQRREQAIEETERKYGPCCHAIAYGILRSAPDAEECVNDTWLSAWNAMPDARPERLGAFLARICRNISLNYRASRNCRKRGGGEIPLAMEELGECVPDTADVARAAELRELSEALDRFLASLPGAERNAFLSRYWAMASVREIAGLLRWTESRTKSTLFRTREKLRRFLLEEGLV